MHSQSTQMHSQSTQVHFKMKRIALVSPRIFSATDTTAGGGEAGAEENTVEQSSGAAPDERPPHREAELGGSSGRASCTPWSSARGQLRTSGIHTVEQSCGCFFARRALRPVPVWVLPAAVCCPTAQ